MWISKEEYNQLKAERDFYEQQLKDWEQEWKKAYKETNPIDEKDKYTKEIDDIIYRNMIRKELKSKNDEIENLKERLCNTFRSYDNLKVKHDKMQVNLDTVKHDLFLSENEVSKVREALDYEAKRNNELFKLNDRLCDKISELEKFNNELKKEKTPVDYLKYYFLEDEVKQLVDLLEVALRDMTLRSTNTIYELQYDSFSHIYRIVTTPKTK